jgi:hypothetical protein
MRSSKPFNNKSFLLGPKLLNTGEFKLFAPIRYRFLEAVPRACETRPRPISLVLKPAKYVSEEQVSFEKPAARRPPLLKVCQGQFHWL